MQTGDSGDTGSEVLMNRHIHHEDFGSCDAETAFKDRRTVFPDQKCDASTFESQTTWVELANDSNVLFHENKRKAGGGA